MMRFTLNTIRNLVTFLILTEILSQLFLNFLRVPVVEKLNLKKRKRYAVWMFPFPPKSHLEQQDGVELICPYVHACGQKLKRINLKVLAEGTNFENYIRDHAYYKMKHLGDFSYHIQAITMILLLLKAELETCVFTIGNSKKIFCNFDEMDLFDNYNPYEDNLTACEFPFSLVGEVEFNSRESFAVWGDMNSPYTVIRTGICNSGEHIQSLASASWLPLITEIRIKEQAIYNYSGYYIANALTPKLFTTSEENPELLVKLNRNMHKFTLTSIFFNVPTVIEEHEEFLKNYTNQVRPFGARSTATESLLKSRKIKAYFSACLTLTTNMQGAALDNIYKSPYTFNNILHPSKRILPETKSKIIIIDVVQKSVLPSGLLSSPDVLYLSANIPFNYPNATDRLDTYSYAYKLLSIYANHAKVIITSRIHVGLPATALGLPVIFVEKSTGLLPGGTQRTGRVAGLLDIFYRVKYTSDWTFGNLTEPILPFAKGVHRADRYRASFWHDLKQTHFYDDTARLFGFIPFQRLGSFASDSSSYNPDFHFILSYSDHPWRIRRAIEHLFYFHPNSKVFIHRLNPSLYYDPTIFTESGYNITFHGNNTMSLQNCGVYLSQNAFLLEPITEETPQGYIISNNATTFAHFTSECPISIQDVITSNNPPITDSSITIETLSESQTESCIIDPDWSSSSQTNHLAIFLSPITLAKSNLTIKYGSQCYKYVEQICIYCNDLHWEY